MPCPLLPYCSQVHLNFIGGMLVVSNLTMESVRLVMTQYLLVGCDMHPLQVRTGGRGSGLMLPVTRMRSPNGRRAASCTHCGLVGTGVGPHAHLLL